MSARRGLAVAAAVGLTAVGLGASPSLAQNAPQAPPPAVSLEGLLPEDTPAAEAVELLTPAELSAVAASASVSVDTLLEIADDPTAYIGQNGGVLYVDEPVPAELFVTAAEAAAAPPAQGPLQNSQTFQLHSRPGSNRVLYLDFNGYELPAGANWNDGVALSALPFSIDVDGATFNQAELDVIQETWQRVSEDMAPFDIDVTTQDPGYAAINRADAADNVYGGRMVITNTPNLELCSTPCGGVSWLGNVDSIGAAHDNDQPSWAFTDGVGFGAKDVAEVISHEFGHAMGLSHDGRTSPVEEYYGGHGMWAPIMGVGYGEPVTQWSKGEYTNPSNTEDDFAVVQANGISLVADETGGGVPGGVPLVPGRSYLTGATPAGDLDTFSYKAPCTGSYTFSLNGDGVAPPGGNANLALQLYSPTGTFLAQDATPPTEVSAEVATGLGSTLTGQALVGGSTYTVGVLPIGVGTASTGFTNYGNVGRYAISVTASCPVNDAFANALVIGGPDATVSGYSNAGATIQASEPNPTCGDTSTNTLWWNWTAPAEGPVTIDTVGSTIDTVLAVYTGPSVSSLTQVGCDDDGGGSQTSSLTFNAVAGRTYRIQVDGFLSGQGNVVLRTRGCGGPNDAFACSRTLPSGPNAIVSTSTVTGANEAYTAESGEANPTCGDTLSANSAWWTWIANGTGSYTLDTAGSTFDTVLAVYSGSAPNALTEVACDDDSGPGTTSSLTFNATFGNTYRIQVDGFGDAAGPIQLKLTDNRPVLRPSAFGTAEGNSGSKLFQIPIVLSAPLPGPVTVNFSVSSSSTTPGIATSGSDYNPVAPGTVTIPAGQTTGFVNVTVLGDTLDEPGPLFGEWIPVLFSSPSVNARLDQTTFFGAGLGIIGDDD